MNTRPKVSVVVAADSTPHQLASLVYGLRSQRRYVERDGVRFVADGDCEVPLEIVTVTNGPLAIEPAVQRQIDQVITGPAESGVGHHLRAVGIAAASGDWLVLTNQDNYYTHGFLHALEPHLLPTCGLIFWNCLSNLWGWTALSGCSLNQRRIDLGCVAVRREFAQQVGFPWRDYEGDWAYIAACLEACKREGLAVVQLREILFVHN